MYRYVEILRHLFPSCMKQDIMGVSNNIKLQKRIDNYDIGVQKT